MVKKRKPEKPKPKRNAPKKNAPKKVASKRTVDDAPPKGMVTRRQLAQVLTVHMQTVTKWEMEGMPIAQRGGKGRPSFYDEAAVRAWRIRREEAAAANAAGAGQLNPTQEKARRERAQAQLAEQTFQIRMRDLLPRAEVERMWSGEYAALRAKLMSIPSTLADRVHRAAIVDGVPGVEKLLEDAVTEALSELSSPERPLPIEQPLPLEPEPPQQTVAQT